MAGIFWRVFHPLAGGFLRRGRAFLGALLLGGALMQGGGANAAGKDIANIAAASDLQFALVDIAAGFRRDSGKTLRLTFGSSGNFRRQIMQGAPFQLYLSADEGYIFQLAKAGLTEGTGALYAIGRIALIVPPNSPLRADGTLGDLAAKLADGRVQKFAIANPEHAPYGRAAREALKTAGLWDAIKGQLVLGENVTQAAQFATSGLTSGGIVSYSLALSPKVAARGKFALIPASWHAPLRQRMVLLKGAGPTARAFYAYLQSPAARAILRKYGFSLPNGG